MSVPTSSVSGLASGIDSAGLIAQLMSIERRPITLMQIRIVGLKEEQAAFQGINTGLLALHTTVEDLQSTITFDAMSATSSNESVLQVDADITATPGVFYDSAPDSGHSVDNLPPAAPAPFTAAFEGGATNLHWGANLEPDFWFYKVYRGSSEDFVPGPGNLIATPSDTGYVDVGPAGSYYKLSAVDVNGNESAFAALGPDETVDVGEGGPLAFALQGLHPNPSRGDRLRVRFVLPSGAPARLEVLDVRGRRVASRDVGSLGAGHHSVDLANGRRLSPGVYLVRLRQGENVGTTRVVVVP